MPILHLVTLALLLHPAQDLATRALVTLVASARDLVLAMVVAHRPGSLLRSRQARQPALALARPVFLPQLLATSQLAVGHLPQVL